MGSTVVTEKDRQPLSVSRSTHARVERLKRIMGAERDRQLNQDDIVSEAVDALEAQRKGKK